METGFERGLTNLSLFQGKNAFVGEVVSRTQEPPQGWWGKLVDIGPRSLLFAGEEHQSELPLLLPAFLLLSPDLPDAPAAFRVRWSSRVPVRGAVMVSRPTDAWIPHELQRLLRPGLILEHGEAGWHLEGIATLAVGLDTVRSQLLLSPPSHRRPREVRSAAVRSLDRLIEAGPPGEDSALLTKVMRRLVAVGIDSVLREAPLKREARRSGETDWIDSIGLLSSVVGRGQGRTRSGDEFLIGLLCGLDLLHYVGDHASSQGFNAIRSQIVKTVDPLLPSTPLLSRHNLRAAFHGLYGAGLLDAADAVADATIFGEGESAWGRSSAGEAEPTWASLLGLYTGTVLAGFSTAMRS